MNLFARSLGLSTLFLSLGCQPVTVSVSHEIEHARPETFAEALDLITRLGTEITEAFKAGQPENAHEQLHQIGHAIEELPALGDKAGLNEEMKKTVAEATEKLAKAFGALDESLHGHTTKSADDVELEVDWAMKQLRTVLSAIVTVPAQ